MSTASGNQGEHCGLRMAGLGRIGCCRGTQWAMLRLGHWPAGGCRRGHQDSPLEAVGRVYHLVTTDAATTDVAQPCLLPSNIHTTPHSSFSPTESDTMR